MIRAVRHTVVLPAVLLVGLACAAASVSTSAAVDRAPASIGAARVLAETAPSTSVQLSIAPGHTVSWQLSVHNTLSEAATVSVEVRSVTGALFGGDHPAALSFWDGDVELAQSAAGAQVEGLRIELGTVSAGQTREITGQATLPAAAGDEYRDADGTVQWRFSLMALGPEEPQPTRPATGASTVAPTPRETRTAQTTTPSATVPPADGTARSDGSPPETGPSIWMSLTALAVAVAFLAAGAVLVLRARAKRLGLASNTGEGVPDD